MPKALQIHLQQPCHENWHNMTPNEQGRFCGSCQKTVVDFSAMSDKELLEYISNVAGYTACGRFSNDQLNRQIRTAKNKRRFSWAYCWNILLATFMITEANAQACPKKKRAIVPSTIARPDTANTAISTIGYKAKTFGLEKIQSQKPELDLSQELIGPLGGYSVGVQVTKTEKIKRAVNNWISSSLKKDVVIYPNPVVRGNNVQLKLTLPQQGDYKLEVLSTSGQIMAVLPLYIQTKEQNVELPTQETWNAGTYWVRISSNTTKKVFQSKLLLQ